MIGRGLVEGLGFGEEYAALWWLTRGRGLARPTEWSRSRNALFIHVPKAAGLSLYQALGMERPPDTHAPAFAWARAEPAFFAGAFRFAVARNPWDRTVSAFHYLKRRSAYPEDRAWAARHLAEAETFGDFLRLLENRWTRNRVMSWRHFLPQCWYLKIEGRLAVDLLIDFDRLDEGAAAAAARIGVAYHPAHVNRSAHDDYRAYYDDAGAELIGRLYAEDVALTGARF